MPAALGVLLRPPPTLHSSKAGKYPRDEGKGCRQGSWQSRGLAHLAELRLGGPFYTTDHCSHVQRHTFLRGCPTSGTCIQHVKPRDLLQCLARTYGEPMADNMGVPKVEPWPTTGNHAAGDVWFDLVQQSFIDGEFIFTIGGVRVCAESWRMAYDVPRSTFEKITRAVLYGDLVWQPEAKANMLMATQAREDDMSIVNRATVWWLDRLRCYDAMPHQPGVINADHCVWSSVFVEEYLIECEIVGVPGGKLSTWKEGKARALLQLAEEVYGTLLKGKPCVLKMRSKHSAFKECTACQDLRLKYKNALKQRLGELIITNIKLEIRVHRAWWLGQRQELERIRYSGARPDILFEQSDACGEDCLNVPSFPRVSTANAGRWTFKVCSP